MNNSDLNRFLNRQYSFTVKDIALLEKAVEDNPWNQSAYQFLAKAKYQTQAVDYDFWLNKAAIYAVSRENLFNYIYKTDKTNTSPTKGAGIKKVEKVKATETVTPKAKASGIKEAEKVSISPLKSPQGEEVKSKEDLRKIVREQLAKIEKERGERQNTKDHGQKTEDKKQEIEDQRPKTKDEAQKKEDIRPKAEAKEQGTKEEEKEVRVEAQKPKTKSQKTILEEFIKTEPSVNRPKDGPYDETLRLARESLVDNLDFVSETLAEIYFRQDNPKKAIKIYEQLMLKVPEKKLYFAARIKEIVDIK